MRVTGGGGRGGAAGSVPIASPVTNAPGQGGGGGGRGNLITYGLTVIQHWTAALGKAEK